MEVAVLSLASLGSCSLGFVKPSYFHSVGYGLAMASMATILLVLHQGHAAVVVVPLVASLIYMFFGLRLALYLYVRQFAPSMQKELQERATRAAQLSLRSKVIMWLSSSLFFVFFVWPLKILWHSSHATSLDARNALLLAGMAFGVVIEAAADLQKYLFKLSHPDRFVSSFLFSLVRHPNYGAEIFFYLCSNLAALNAGASSADAGVALLGLAIISSIILFGGLRKLEAKQSQTYGKLPEYTAYLKSTKKIIPFVF